MTPPKPPAPPVEYTKATRLRAIEAAALRVVAGEPGAVDALKATLDIKPPRYALFTREWVEQNGFNEYDSEAAALQDFRCRMGRQLIDGEEEIRRCPK